MQCLKSLRDYIDALRGYGGIQEIDAEVNLRLERLTFPRPVRFENCRPGMRPVS